MILNKFYYFYLWEIITIHWEKIPNHNTFWKIIIPKNNTYWVK